MPYHPDDGLIHHSKETYGASFDTALIEQYKICLLYTSDAADE